MRIERPDCVQPFEPQHAWRLLNTGATVIVSAAYQGECNAMAAAWNMALDYAPDSAKCAVVIDKSSYTRRLIEGSNRFALGVAVRSGAAMCMAVGTQSATDFPDHNKLGRLNLRYFDGSLHAQGALPLLDGCAGWLECERLPEPRNEEIYDLFIGRITAAWADTRCTTQNKFLPLADIPSDLRTIHHLGKGQFVVPGEQFTSPASGT